MYIAIDIIHVYIHVQYMYPSENYNCKNTIKEITKRHVRAHASPYTHLHACAVK